MHKYVWCEDSKSGFEFWTLLFSVIDPEIIVESKKNNSGLRKSVCSIDVDDFNQYYILIDEAIDNIDVLREIRAINRKASGQDNISIVNIHCFEFVLLSFEELEAWVFAAHDDLKDKREQTLRYKDVFVDFILNSRLSDALSEFNLLLHHSVDYNTEHIADRLLYDITRNTGFETNKSRLGACFKVNCCDWEQKQDDDICGLDERQISFEEKMKRIYEKSVIKRAFAKAGLVYDNCF